MDKFIKNKKKHIDKILKLLNQSKMSDEGYSSCAQPFCSKNPIQDFKQGNKSIPEIPEDLNRNFKLLYELVSNPDVEIYINKWTILSLSEALKQYKQYCDEGQKNVFNVAYRYLGLGHVEVLSCNLYNHLLFLRRDGGSNGYDCADNHKQVINFDYKQYEYMYFENWYSSVMNP